MSEYVVNLPYPHDVTDIASVKEYLCRLRASLQDDSAMQLSKKIKWANLINKPFVNVLEYGAKPWDSSYDNTTAIQAALTAVPSSGGTVYLPPGTYLTSSVLSLKSNTTLLGAGMDSSIIYGKTVTDDILKATGSLGTSIDLNANASKGEITLTMASAPTWVENDLLLLQSTDSYSNHPTNAYKAEIVRVLSVSTVTVTLCGRLQDDYTTANGAKASKINTKSGIKLQGFQILGNPIAANKNVNGLRFSYIKDSIIDEIKCTRTCATGMTFQTSYNIRVNKSMVSETLWNLSGWSYGYGIQAYDATTDIIVNEAHVEKVQHAITFGGTLPVRFARITNSYLTSHRSNNPIDVHLGDEIYFENSTVVGSCGVANGNIVLRDCDIYSNGNIHCIANRDLNWMNLKLDGCRFFQTTTDPDVAATVEALIKITYSTVERLTIDNCEFHLPGIVPDEAVIWSAADKNFINNNKIFSDQAGVTGVSITNDASLLSLIGNHLSECPTPYTSAATVEEIAHNT